MSTFSPKKKLTDGNSRSIKPFGISNGKTDEKKYGYSIGHMKQSELLLV